MNPAVNARRFELYVSWSLYLIMTVPLFNTAVLLVALRPTTTASVFACVASVASVGATLWFCRSRLISDPAPRPSLVQTVALLTLATVTAVANLWWTSTSGNWGPATSSTLMLQVSFAPMFTVAVLTMTLTPRAASLASLSLLVLQVPAWRFAHAPWPVAVVAVIFLSSTIWLTLWMLRVQRELQRAHTRDAQLSLAEERLRISRDLHDVFGRTLATISVKSELASELARRGRSDEAAAEMAQIRQISDDAGREVRRVVRGEIATTFGAELDGARALLASAGITCTVTIDGVPATDASALAERPDLHRSGPLGWVVRESVTNILRHSKATVATISVDVGADETSLVIANDGAGEAAPEESRGTGLASLRARLGEHHGTLDAHHGGGWFTLTATLNSGQVDDGASEDSTSASPATTAETSPSKENQ